MGWSPKGQPGSGIHQVRRPTNKPERFAADGFFCACDTLRFTQRPYRYKASMNDDLIEAVQDLQEQAAELDYLDDLDLDPGADFDNGDMPR